MWKKSPRSSRFLKTHSLSAAQYSANSQAVTYKKSEKSSGHRWYGLLYIIIVQCPDFFSNSSFENYKRLLATGLNCTACAIRLKRIPLPSFIHYRLNYA